jgi:hypothetical protein
MTKWEHWNQRKITSFVNKITGHSVQNEMRRTVKKHFKVMSLKPDKVSELEQVQDIATELTCWVSCYSPVCCGLLGLTQDRRSLHCISHDSCSCQCKRKEVQCMELSTKIWNLVKQHICPLIWLILWFKVWHNVCCNAFLTLKCTWQISALSSRTEFHINQSRVFRVQKRNGQTKHPNTILHIAHHLQYLMPCRLRYCSGSTNLPCNAAVWCWA